MSSSNSERIRTALRAIKDSNVDAVDYSVRTMENGQVVSTTQRIFNGTAPMITNLMKPTDRELFLENGLPNIPFLKEFLKQEGRLHNQQVIKIFSMATKVLRKEPNLLCISAPVTICGDIHGQYYDLLTLFEMCGDPIDTSYLFLGDYVDRGFFSMECLLLLYSYKVTYPGTFFLLRGNHECKHLTEYFTFKRECLHKYDYRVYDAACESFNALPLATILNSKIFCCHGGISPELNTPEDVNRLNRFREPPTRGLMCDLLWSDPIEDYDCGTDDDPAFLLNRVRGCSFAYTFRGVSQFLRRNNLLCVIRAHEAQSSGYRMYKKSVDRRFPTLFTIFSAPNYLDTYRNRGAVLKYSQKSMNIKEFSSSPHPYWLPNFMDVFSWSLPFVSEKVTDVLLSVLNICTEEELLEEELLEEASLLDDELLHNF